MKQCANLKSNEMKQQSVPVELKPLSFCFLLSIVALSNRSVFAFYFFGVLRWEYKVMGKIKSTNVQFLSFAHQYIIKMVSF